MEPKDYDVLNVTPPAWNPDGPALDAGVNYAWQRPSTEDYRRMLDERKKAPDWNPDPPQDTPPAIDRETDIARKKFQAFVLGNQDDRVGQQNAQAFWRNIWENPVTNNPLTQGVVNTLGGIKDDVGRGFEASGDVTHAGLSTIGAAFGEIGRGTEEKRLADMKAGTYDYGTKAGGPFASRRSVIQQYFEAKNKVDQSDEFRARVKGIADAAGLPVDDWRVIMNAAGDTSSAHPSGLQTAAELFSDPTNLAFAGPGTALKGAKAAGRALSGAGGKVVEGLEGAFEGGVNPFAGALNREVAPVTAGRRIPAKPTLSPKSQKTLDTIKAGGNVDPKDLKAMWDESEALAGKVEEWERQRKAITMSADSATEAKIPQGKAPEGDQGMAEMMRKQNARNLAEGKPARWTEQDIQDATDGIVGKPTEEQLAEAARPLEAPSEVASEDAALQELTKFIETNPSAKDVAFNLINKGNSPEDVLRSLKDQALLAGKNKAVPEVVDAGEAKMQAIVNNMRAKGRKAEIRPAGEGKFDVVSQGGSKISGGLDETTARSLANEVNRRIDSVADLSPEQMAAVSKMGKEGPAIRGRLTGGKKGATPLGSRIAAEAASRTGAPRTAVEEVIAKAEAQAELPSVDQTTIFMPDEVDKGAFTDVRSGPQPFMRGPEERVPDMVTNDVPGWRNPNPVGDVQQAMIDAGVRQKGTFDPINAIGGIGDWVVRGPRELLATGDISGSLRQGIIGFGMHNNEWRAAMGDQVKALLSPEGMQSVIDSTTKLPSYDFGLSVGLASRFGDLPANYVGKGAAARYEAFTDAISRDIPVLGGLVEASDRAYEAFLGSLRARIFDTYAKSWGLLDVEAISKMTPAQQFAKRREAQQLADFVNSITGHGHLGYLEDPKMAGALNKMFFAPRFFASRLNTIFSPLVYTGKAAAGQGSWRVAALAWRDVVGFAAETFGMMQLAKWAGADVDMNPTSSTFGQITVGDHHIDLTGGFTRTFGVLSQVITGKHTTGSGRTYSIRGAKEKPVDMDMNEVVLRFLFQKANAPITIAAEAASGVNAGGEELTPADYIQAPLGLRNVVEAAANDLKKEGLPGALKGAGIGALELLGGSVQTYEKRRSSGGSSWQ